MSPSLKIEMGAETWYHANAAAKRCGYKDPKKAISMHVPKDMCQVCCSLLNTSRFSHNQSKCKYISTLGLKTLIVKSRNPGSLAYAKSLGIDISHFKIETAEMSSFKHLMTIFDGEPM